MAKNSVWMRDIILLRFLVPSAPDRKRQINDTKWICRPSRHFGGLGIEIWHLKKKWTKYWWFAKLKKKSLNKNLIDHKPKLCDFLTKIEDENNIFQNAWLVGITVNLKMTFWIVMLIKIRLYSNFMGQWIWIWFWFFAYRFNTTNIAKLSISGNPEIVIM